MSIFINDLDSYRRKFNIWDAYIDSMAIGLTKVFNKPLEEMREYVKKVVGKGGRLEVTDPPMKYVGRNKFGDRALRETTFLDYIKRVADNDFIISPSMTVYQNSNRIRSVSAIYIDENIAKRSKSKKEMFAAKAAGDMALHAYKNNEQQTAKIKNNALSGAHCSVSTPMYLDTIHSTLTSTCRSASGYGNANNEKVISGNRHYWSPDIVQANIVTIIRMTDMVAFQKTMDTYGLVHPTVDEVMECIQYSTDFYWKNKKRMVSIRRLVEGLSDVERSAFTYVGDLHHIAKHNPDVVRDLLKNLSEVRCEKVENPKTYIESMSEEMAALVSLLCGKMMGGNKLNKFDDFSESTQDTLAATAKGIVDTMNKYELFIKNIFVNDSSIPASVAHLPNIIRRCAITSDTDSTIFTTQDWMQWYTGRMDMSDECRNVGHAVAFLTSSSITHILAQMSANLGIEKKSLTRYAMKSEFYFPVFSLTSRAKTYFALIEAQEGQVFTELDKEIKGAVLKASTSPKFIVDGAMELLNEILMTVYEDKKIQIIPILKRVAALENQIVSSIHSGSTEFFKRVEIKDESGYKGGKYGSPYFHYVLWKDVFAVKYGSIPEPPYPAVKISLATDKPSTFKRWFDGIEDNAFKERLTDLLKEANKRNIGSINLPIAITSQMGIPKEILDAMDIRSILSQLMEPYYVLLECLGVYNIEKNQQRLISDLYSDLIDK